MAVEMISFDEAISLIDKHVVAIGSETVALADAAGRVLAAPVVARSDSPRAAVAAMDGYAVNDAATEAGTAYSIIGESQAGRAFDGVVKSGEAVRIFTGAKMPQGTDRCIMQEYAQREGDRVTFADGYGPARHVRAAASDFSSGDALLESGVTLTPQAMIAAAASDRAVLTVARRPNIAIISTGDELRSPGEAHLDPDSIPESVTYGVAALARNLGAQIVQTERGGDDLRSLEVLAESALAAADVVITTGGASVGERDFAKPMFAPHGLELIFGKVAIKPGKPVWLGRAGGKWVLGLPGNPTSAMVTARVFLAPLLARLQGSAIADSLSWKTFSLAAPLAATGSRETFVRAKWEKDGLVPVSNQESGAQAALAKADCLIRCPPNQGRFEAGAEVSALLLS